MSVLLYLINSGIREQMEFGSVSAAQVTGLLMSDSKRFATMYIHNTEPKCGESEIYRFSNIERKFVPASSIVDTESPINRATQVEQTLDMWMYAHHKDRL